MIAGAFCLFTGAWVAWGWFTPGDFFANGSDFLEVSLVAAAGLGLLLGRKLPQRLQAILLVASLFALGFWLFVPTGWWAHELPGAVSGMKRMDLSAMPSNTSLERTRDR